MRRAMIATGLSVALLGATASSASAATWSPPTVDFGRVPVVNKPVNQFTYPYFRDVTLCCGTETPFYVHIGITEDTCPGRPKCGVFPHARFTGEVQIPGSTCPEEPSRTNMRTCSPSCDHDLINRPAGGSATSGGNIYPSCSMRVYFTPAEPGRVTGRLLSNAEVPGSPVVLLSGTGVAKKCKKKGGKTSAVAAKKRCKKK